jgi:hypothetical protein
MILEEQMAYLEVNAHKFNDSIALPELECPLRYEKLSVIPEAG